MERKLMSTSIPSDFVWPKLNPLMLQRMRTKQLELAWQDSVSTFSGWPLPGPFSSQTGAIESCGSS